MSLTDQIDALHSFLATHPRPAGVPVSDYLQRCARAGDPEARRILGSGLFNATGAAVDAPKPAAQVPPAVLAREQRIATQQLPQVRNTAEPRRPMVQSGKWRPWLLGR